MGDSVSQYGRPRFCTEECTGMKPQKMLEQMDFIKDNITSAQLTSISEYKKIVYILSTPV